MTEINIVRFGNEVSADTISYYNELKLELDNNKFHQTTTNIQLSDACVDRWGGLRKNHILKIRKVIKYIIDNYLKGNLLITKNKQDSRYIMILIEKI